MTLSYWLDGMGFTSNEIASTSNFDIVIIGAGIAGLSTAYWLEKKDSNLKIAILDQGSIGGGASGRNAGFVTCGSAEHFAKLEKQFGLEKAVVIWKFSETNRELLKSEIIQNDFAGVDYEQTGSCTVAASENDWQRYQSLIKTMQSAGLDASLIQEQDLIRDYGVRNFLGAIQYNQDGTIHPIKLLKKMKSKLQRTQFIFDSKVLSLEPSGLSWNLKTNRGVVTTGKVIFCLNGYTDTVLPELKQWVKPQRGQIIVTQPLKKFVKGPCYLTKHLCYFRQLPMGELLVGGFRNHDIEAENTNQDAITEKIQTALQEFTQSYFQNTPQVKINYRWSGVMGFTPDGQMIVGEHPEKKGIHIMAGCGGHGMGLSFHIASKLVANMFGGLVPEHLDISRFKI